MKNDPSYVRWIFKIAGFKDNERYERLLPSHKCTDADYDEFYPINPDQAVDLQKMREDPDRGFLCLDWDNDDPIKIFG